MDNINIDENNYEDGLSYAKYILSNSSSIEEIRKKIEPDISNEKDED